MKSIIIYNKFRAKYFTGQETTEKPETYQSDIGTITIMRFLQIFEFLLICLLGKSLNIKYLSSFKIFTENTFYRLLKNFCPVLLFNRFPSSCAKCPKEISSGNRSHGPQGRC